MLQVDPPENDTPPTAFPHTARPLTRTTTIVDIARWRAEHHPSRLAFTFLADGEREDGTLTARELDQRARSIAAGLRARGAAGQRVLLSFQPGLDLVAALFGCLYAGSVAVLVPPPDPLRLARTLPRLKAIVEDATPRITLGSPDVLELVAAELRTQGQIQTLDLNGLVSESSAKWRPDWAVDEQPIILQYTSGSTGTPRGVVLTHKNLMHSLKAIEKRDVQRQVASGRTAVSWLPPYHDMGLIGCTLMPVFTGRKMILMSPLSFVERPIRWLRAISHYRAESTAGPNFAFDLCVRRVNEEECRDLDLSCWRVAVVGAETVQAETLDRFVEAFEPYGFCRRAFLPAYGLAEAVVNVTGINSDEMPLVECFSSESLFEGKAEVCAADDPDRRRLVGCGPAQPDEQLIIVDPESREALEPGRIGEIWFQSPHVVNGYWNLPEETERAFRASIHGSAEGPFLRTGDLGFLHENQLFVVGRLKELIIVGGRNFYPQDIERVMANSHPALARCSGMAFSCDGGGREHLVLVQELRRARLSSKDEILASIRREIAQEFLLSPQAILLVPGGVLPTTSSGKPSRAACRELYLRGNLEVLAQWHASSRAAAAGHEFVGPRSPLEIEIAAAVRELLGLESVSIHDDLFSLGITSLLVTELLMRLRHLAPEGFPLQSLIGQTTVAGLANAILAYHLERCPDAARLLDRLESASDEEALRLMGKRDFRDESGKQAG